MSQVDPCWTEALAAAERFGALQARHRADGVVSPGEAEREARAFRGEVFAAVVNVADVLGIAQAVMRRGPEGVRAASLIAQRERRLADAARFAPDAPEAA